MGLSKLLVSIAGVRKKGEGAIVVLQRREEKTAADVYGPMLRVCPVLEEGEWCLPTSIGLG